MSPGERALLVRLRDELGLTNEDVASIETDASRPAPPGPLPRSLDFEELNPP